jgi:hypothetical protein
MKRNHFNTGTTNNPTHQSGNPADRSRPKQRAQPAQRKGTARHSMINATPPPNDIAPRANPGNGSVK